MYPQSGQMYPLQFNGNRVMYNEPAMYNEPTDAVGAIARMQSRETEYDHYSRVSNEITRTFNSAVIAQIQALGNPNASMRQRR